ncbi:OmpA family protein [Lysobacter sp. F6437]|uniref:OmpA family protein n=1 Tax=Lysobacter sp. F6437 TaxID=3459296 RepID=UPI00403E00EA
MKRITLPRAPRAILVALLPFALAACSGGEPAPADADSPNGAEVGADQIDRDDAPSDHAAEPASTVSDRFEIDSVPVSDASLGAFPYFALPPELESGEEQTFKFDHFPFWVGDRMVWVEGRIYSAGFTGTDDQDFSPLAVRRNIESMIEAAGGRKIAEGRIPPAMTEQYEEDDVAIRYVDGKGDVYNEPASTYLVRRADRDIWVHLSTNNIFGGWIIAETQAFTPTATLLPASELKQQLDTAGKVALQVNFATDKAEILPESQPQIEQVVQLLKDDPALELSINGHTDDTGDAAHNRQLSEARAASVVAALAAQDIDAERLDANGFGQDQPVADNGTAEGRAKNRRVELVKAD